MFRQTDYHTRFLFLYFYVFFIFFFYSAYNIFFLFCHFRFIFSYHYPLRFRYLFGTLIHSNFFSGYFSDLLYLSYLLVSAYLSFLKCFLSVYQRLIIYYITLSRISQYLFRFCIIYRYYFILFLVLYYSGLFIYLYYAVYLFFTHVTYRVHRTYAFSASGPHRFFRCRQSYFTRICFSGLYNLFVLLFVIFGSPVTLCICRQVGYVQYKT